MVGESTRLTARTGAAEESLATGSSFSRTFFQIDYILIRAILCCRIGKSLIPKDRPMHRAENIIEMDLKKIVEAMGLSCVRLYYVSFLTI